MKTIVSQIPNRKSFLKGHGGLKIGFPWLTFGAIIALEHIVNKEMTVLELGSGGSTIFWSKNCKFVKSYETDPGWYKKVKQKIKDLSLKNVEIVLNDRRGTRIGLQAEPEEGYDIVLIDSDPRRSRRLFLAEIAISKIKMNGWMVIDNYRSYGMRDFDYTKFQVYTFDEFDYGGLGTRLCKKIL